MKVLDVDMDYFLYDVAHNISPKSKMRLNDSYKVWEEENIINFIEKNLGLSKDKKIKGRIVTHHDEALYYWKELIEGGLLEKKFEVIHVDSHSDLGFSDSGKYFIFEKLLGLEEKERSKIEEYKTYFNEYKLPNIGNYLLFAIAFRWISKLTYVSNPVEKGNDYPFFIIKNFNDSSDDSNKIIQLHYNEENSNVNNEYTLRKIVRNYNQNKKIIQEYLKNSKLEPEVPFEIKKTIEEVKYNGDFDFITFCISPNYTPENADFIIDIFRDYIEEN